MPTCEHANGSAWAQMERAEGLGKRVTPAKGGCPTGETGATGANFQEIRVRGYIWDFRDLGTRLTRFTRKHAQARVFPREPAAPLHTLHTRWALRPGPTYRPRIHPYRPPPRGRAARRAAAVLRYRLMQAITRVRITLETKTFQRDYSCNTDGCTDISAPEPSAWGMPEIYRGYPADA